MAATLVGRSVELASLLDACHSGPGGLVLLTGCAGSGKTTLLEELRRRVTAAGAVASSGHAVPGGGPFRPLAEALVRIAPPSLADEEQVSPFRAVLARIMPTWPPGPASGVHLVDPVVVLGEAVLALLRVLSMHKRVVLVLDDAHWADRDTLALLDYLGGGLHEVAASLVVDVELEYWERGPRDAPAVFLVHAGVFGEWFRPMFDEPTLDGFRVVRVHRAGYGVARLVAEAVSAT